VSGVAYTDPLSSYRKRKTLWGIKTSSSTNTCQSVNLVVPVSNRTKIIVHLSY
jgi:hypothetical protein